MKREGIPRAMRGIPSVVLLPFEAPVPGVDHVDRVGREVGAADGGPVCLEGQRDHDIRRATYRLAGDHDVGELALTAWVLASRRAAGDVDGRIGGHLEIRASEADLAVLRDHLVGVLLARREALAPHVAVGGNRAGFEHLGWRLARHSALIDAVVLRRRRAVLGGCRGRRRGCGGGGPCRAGRRSCGRAGRLGGRRSRRGGGRLGRAGRGRRRGRLGLDEPDDEAGDEYYRKGDSRDDGPGTTLLLSFRFIGQTSHPFREVLADTGCD